MADQFQISASPQQSPNAPQTAFGDYRYGAEIARTLDTIGQVSLHLKQKHDQRIYTKFLLDNEKKSDAILNTPGLKAKDVIPEYETYFRESVKNLPEDLRERAEVDVYLRTVRSGAFQRRIAELESLEEQELLGEIYNEFSQKWIRSKFVSSEDLDGFYATVKTLDIKDERQLAEIEYLALQKADSLESFDSMVKNLKFAKDNPNRINALRRQLNNALITETNSVNSAISSELTELFSRVQDPAFQHTAEDIIDIQALAESGASEEDIRKAYQINFFISGIKAVSYASPEYFKGLSDEATMESTLRSSGFEQKHINYLLKNKSTAASFRKLAEHYQSLPAADRVQTNPEVQQKLKENDIVGALETAWHYYGDPPTLEEGDELLPYEEVIKYQGLKEKEILVQHIPTDIIKKTIQETNPDTRTAKQIVQYEENLKAQLGRKWYNLVKVATAQQMIRGSDTVEKDSRNAVFQTVRQFVSNKGVDMLMAAYTDTGSKHEAIASSGKTEAELDAEISARLFETGFMSMFQDAMKGHGTAAFWGSFEGLIRNMVYARTGGKAELIDRAIEDVEKVFSYSFVVIAPRGSASSIFIPKEYHIMGRGPDDYIFNRLRNLFSSEQERMDPLYEDPHQKHKWIQTFEQGMENPLENLPYRAIQPGAPPWTTIPDMGTLVMNALRQAERNVKTLYRSIHAQRPWTAYNPEKYYWAGFPEDSRQEMYLRTLVRSGFSGKKPGYRIEQAWGPNGEAGFRIYIASPYLNDDKRVSEKDAIYDVPLMDRKTGQPAFISFFELSQPDTFDTTLSSSE